MSSFSDESVFLIENWDDLQHVLSAEKHLRNEVKALLHAVEPALSEYSWWQHGWVFVNVW